MYTQVTFGEFLDRPLARAKAEHGIDFRAYPNPAVRWLPGDWLYEIVNSFDVRIFRWALPECEALIAGPLWDDPSETREQFEARFEKDFSDSIKRLKDHSGKN
jgi:hypothetical protein